MTAAIFAKAGEEITGDNGKVWGRFTRDVRILDPILATDVVRVDGTNPEPDTQLTPEVMQFMKRRQRERHKASN